MNWKILAISTLFIGSFASAGTFDPPADLGPVKDIQSNKLQTYCAIDAKDLVRCWGVNPHEVPANLGPVRALSLSYDEVCAITMNYELNCWGLNNYGPNRELPPIPPEVKHAKLISVGYLLTCAVALDGKSYCWDGWKNPARALPSEFNDPRSITVYSEGACIINSENKILCVNKWDGPGQQASKYINPPQDSALSLSFDDFDEGCMMSTGHEVKCLGVEFDHHASGPLPADLGLVNQVSAARLNACALQLDGEIKCWDLLDTSQGYYSGVSTPPQIKAISIATGLKSGCAILEDHTVQCW